MIVVTNDTNDELFMARALELAARGEGAVEPNPMVGCVLVRDGRIVGEGWHQEFGGPHAEINAIKQAGPLTTGSTAFVTLEPCCHQGKTPPCTNALKITGVKRVVAVMEHCAKDGSPKILKKCTLPITAEGVVNLVITDLCVFEVKIGGGLVLIELHPGATVDDIRAKTGAPFDVALKR